MQPDKIEDRGIRRSAGSSVYLYGRKALPFAPKGRLELAFFFVVPEAPKRANTAFGAHLPPFIKGGEVEHFDVLFL